MAYLTFFEQTHAHLHFLHSKGFDISELKIDAGFVRCHLNGETNGRGGLAYKTSTKRLESGLLGIWTWCRCSDGSQDRYKSYGYGPNDGDAPVFLRPETRSPSSVDLKAYEEAARKAYGFWSYSKTQGESDYLKRKGVGSYGIRFRDSKEYGNVAVIPMYDVNGHLWSYQLLNADGSKHNANGGRTRGVFHSLRPIINGQTFGIAESYVTAATCMEITGLPVVCAFGSNNIGEVFLLLSSRFPDSRVVIFADNDRHLPVNKGLECAEEVAKMRGDRVIVIAPDFGSRQPAKDESDWNDLVRVLGRGVAERQLSIISGLRLSTGQGRARGSQSSYQGPARVI